MVFLVKTTPQADEDADALLAWLDSHAAGEAGIRWFLALQDAIASLESMPKRCALAPEDPEFPFEVRQLLFGRPPHVFRILFTLEGSTVYVLHIRHGRRQRLAGDTPFGR